MRVAVTGVSGFIGSYAARRLADAGHQVVGLVRSESRRDHIDQHIDRFVVGDQADESAWDELLADADCLVHNSVDWTDLKSGRVDCHFERNLLGSCRLIEHVRRLQKPCHIIFISTVAVHHLILSRWNHEIDEDHPMRPANYYGAYKAAVESHLWAAHFGSNVPITILRPCAVYGLDPNLERSIGYPIVNRIRDGKPFTRSGGGKFVHVADVAGAIALSVAEPPGEGRIINLADCYARWADWARMTAELLGVDASIDESSPSTSRNTFSKQAAVTLGVPLGRGHDGIRTHLAELIEAMSSVVDSQ